MPLPKRRHSHQRTALRRTHYTTDLPEVAESKQVGAEANHLWHHASPDGYHKGRRLPGFKDKKRG